MARTNRTTNGNNQARTTGAQELAELIRRRAYELYQKRGQTHGNDMTDWLQAEREVKQKNGYRV